MNKYKVLDGWFHQIEIYMEMIAQVFVFILMLVSVANVVGRFLGYPIIGAIESSILLLAFIIFLGLAYAQSQNANVGIEMVTNYLSPRKKVIVELVALFLSLAILSIMFWRTGVEGIEAFRIKTFEPGIISFPTWPGRLIIPFGLFFFIVRVIIQIMAKLIHFRDTRILRDESLEAGI